MLWLRESQDRSVVWAGDPNDKNVTVRAPTWTGTLQDGDILILHSDGLRERRDPSLARSGALLAGAARAAHQESLPALADLLLSAVPGRKNDESRC